MRSNDPDASFLIDVLNEIYVSKLAHAKERERRGEGGRGRKEGSCVLTPRQPWPLYWGEGGGGGGERTREREREREGENRQSPICDSDCENHVNWQLMSPPTPIAPPLPPPTPIFLSLSVSTQKKKENPSELGTETSLAPLR